MYVAVLLGRVAVQVLPAPAVTVMPPEQVTVAEPPEGRPERVSVTIPPPISGDTGEAVRISGPDLISALVGFAVAGVGASP